MTALEGACGVHSGKRPTPRVRARSERVPPHADGGEDEADDEPAAVIGGEKPNRVVARKPAMATRRAVRYD